MFHPIDQEVKSNREHFVGPGCNILTVDKWNVSDLPFTRPNSKSEL